MALCKIRGHVCLQDLWSAAENQHQAVPFTAYWGFEVAAVSDKPSAGSSPVGSRVSLQVPRPGDGTCSVLPEMTLTVENAVRATMS